MTENINPRWENIKIRKRYNAREFFEFTEDDEGRYELIDGQIKLMASPSVSHQRIIRDIGIALAVYLEGKTCEPFIAPLDVVLFDKNESGDEEKASQNVFQPDVFVVCDPIKISKNRINGAPDFIVEVVSPSNSEDDYIKKLSAYMKYGVREYWIVNPETKKILVYIKDEKEMAVDTYTFEDKIQASIFEDFAIDFKGLVI